MKKRSLQFLILGSFVFSRIICAAQSFEEIGYHGELMRSHYFPFDSIWLFHPDTSSDITLLPTDDKGWKKVNSEFLRDEKGRVLDWSNVGWFRKKFDSPAGIAGGVIAMRIGHFGASEIYIDGKLIVRYGTVSNSIEGEKIFVPRRPLIIQLDSQATHIIDVRYSNQHAKSPGYRAKFIGFRVLFAPPDFILKVSLSKLSPLPVTVGILFIFTLFFLFVYLFNRKRLASVLTACLLLTPCALFAITYLRETQNEWEPLVRASGWETLLSTWITCWQVLIIYTLYYNGKLPRRSWLIAGVMLFTFIPAFVSSSFSLAALILSLLVDAEFFRIIILGVFHKKPGFWILLIGAIIQHIGFFVFVVDIFNLFPIMTITQEILLMIFPQMGLPLTYALHLAWEFGAANRDLRLQLVQVNKLSETTIRQEQEKQEILTQQKEKLETMVADRTKELSLQKEELQNTLSHLKSTQSQLIQSEKMASLGELTAGIAHEIQNPLNFVNNFSEINTELIEELKNELTNGNQQSAMGIANDIKDNEQKINHHGKRADAIVKGMLQHSRSGSGHKEMTNINALADEYLRLSYHGLRAKDKSFNAELKTDLDSNLPLVNIVPQDIGRAILNLFTNAFYSVNQKKALNPASYAPAVSVSTRRIGSNLEIRVSDNGMGIPQKALDKIFQPFFTTKPTGQGTGLGLSLTYDIVTKAHGGELSVETKEGEGAEFIILLPL